MQAASRTPSLRHAEGARVCRYQRALHTSLEICPTVMRPKRGPDECGTLVPSTKSAKGLTLEPFEHKTETVTLLIQNRPTSEYYVWVPKLLYDPKLVPQAVKMWGVRFACKLHSHLGATKSSCDDNTKSTLSQHFFQSQAQVLRVHEPVLLSPKF